LISFRSAEAAISAIAEFNIAVCQELRQDVLQVIPKSRGHDTAVIAVNCGPQ
jgi:hypothetical protein